MRVMIQVSHPQTEFLDGISYTFIKKKNKHQLQPLLSKCDITVSVIKSGTAATFSPGKNPTVKQITRVWGTALPLSKKLAEENSSPYTSH